MADLLAVLLAVCLPSCLAEVLKLNPDLVGQCLLFVLLVPTKRIALHQK